MSHLLVVANETVAGRALTEAVERRKAADPGHGRLPGERAARGLRRLPGHPAGGRPAPARQDARAAAGEGISADGFVVETDPVDAVRDALAQLEPPVNEIIVSTHPESRSGWMKRDVVERIEKVAGSSGRARGRRPDAGGRRGERARDRERDGG